MWRAIALGIALALSPGLAPFGNAQSYPAHTDVYVNDFANLLTFEEEAEVRADLTGLYDRTGIEAVVVTLATMGHSGPIEPYATGLFNSWGVGDATRNDGVLVLVARDDRQMRIELGSGYAPAMNADMQVIIDDSMLPKFREGDYASGIRSGVSDLIRRLEVHAGVAKPYSLLERAERGVRSFSATVLAMLAAIAAALLAGGLRLYQFWRRRQPRMCPIDGARMELMSETLDDSRLQPGQTTEERLGSVDYDVWSCPKCQHVTIESYRRWFSSYGACRACNYRTLQGTTTIVRAATTTHSGQKRIDYHCLNCNDNWSETKTIPQESDSDSGRSSFGGGSSSGGGASGRW